MTRTVLGETILSRAKPLWCCPASPLSLRQVAPELLRHGLARQDEGACAAAADGGDFILLHHKNKYDFKYSLYHKFYDIKYSLYHSFSYIPTLYHGFLKNSWYQDTQSTMI